MRILLPLADGVEPLEAVTIIDVLRRAHLEVTTVALKETLAVKGAHQILLTADTTWTAIDPDQFDAIVLPGGGKGTEHLSKDDRILETLRAFDASRRPIAAICAAPMVLAKAGIIGTRRVTAYPECAKTLGAHYDDVPVVIDDNLITGQGPGTALLFSLVLVNHFVGKAMAQQLAEAMLTSLE